MTVKQTLLLEQSRLRESINSLLALDELSDEQRGEMTKATERSMELEGELRAAIVAEPEVTITEKGDTEARELRELMDRASLEPYLLRCLGSQTNGRGRGRATEAFRHGKQSGAFVDARRTRGNSGSWKRPGKPV